MFFNFEPNFIEKFLWESGFPNFGHVTFLQNDNSFFGRLFETKHFLIVLFSDIWLFWVCTHMVHVSYGNSYGKVLKNERAQTGVKSSLGT